MTTLAQYEHVRVYNPALLCQREETTMFGVRKYIKTSPVTEAEYRTAHRATGSIYFIQAGDAGPIKVGHSRDPLRRLQELQVGNGAVLKPIGLVAAEPSIEPAVHAWLHQFYIQGEWFHGGGPADGCVHEWLLNMTANAPLRRQVWTRGASNSVLHIWHEETKSHIRHVWNPEISKWEPPLR